MLFLLGHAARRFGAKIVPNLCDEMRETFARKHAGGARPRQIDLDDLFDAPRTITQHDDAIAQLHGFRNTVRDQQRRLMKPLPNFKQLLTEQQTRLLVERRERFVHQAEICGSAHNARASAVR